MAVCEPGASSAASQTLANDLSPHRRQLCYRTAFRNQVGRRVALPGSAWHSSVDSQVYFSRHDLDVAASGAGSSVADFGVPPGHFFCRDCHTPGCSTSHNFAALGYRRGFRGRLFALVTYPSGAGGDHLLQEIIERTAPVQLSSPLSAGLVALLLPESMTAHFVEPL